MTHHISPGSQKKIDTTSADYSDIIMERSPSGVPVLCSTKALGMAITDNPIFGKIVGKAVSQKALSILSDNPPRAYLIANFVKILQKDTEFIIIATSHDQSRSGAPRKDSEGHLAGSATDFIFTAPSADGKSEELKPIVDLINSVAFLSYLRDMAKEIFPIMSATSNLWSGRSLIIGVEYDHIHIEWPWSNRILPSNQAGMRLTGIPATIELGVFYHPQPSYGLPAKRAGLGESALLML